LGSGSGAEPKTFIEPELLGEMQRIARQDRQVNGRPTDRFDLSAASNAIRARGVASLSDRSSTFSAFRKRWQRICQIQESLKFCRALPICLQMSPISGVLPSVSLPSALNSGLGALAASNQRLNQDAQQIANPDNQNLASPLLDASQSLLLAEAGAAVIKTSNRMLGTLLDAFA
jgi:hypothetical protein